MKKLKSPTFIFNSVFILLSFSSYIISGADTLFPLTDLTFKIALITSVLLLTHYTIPLPPKGNSLSMDSAVYLACNFLYGLNFTLDILFLTSLIYMVYDRKVLWWKHLLNFSMYNFMIISSYFSFIGLGGQIGVININNLFPYLISLIIYFLINILIASMHFLLSLKESLLKVLSGIIKETMAGYLSTLLLSLILSMLIESHQVFGLILFVCVAVLLSLAFKQHSSLYQEVSEKAIKDHLTGLSNHGFFKDKLKDTIRFSNENNQPFSLALLDLDDFKKYNDLYGHLQGDYLLKFFGTLLEEQCTLHSYFVARYGGEEFAILMPNTPKKEAAFFIDRLRKTVNDTYFDGVELLPYRCLSFSAGIVEYEKELYNSTELLRKADQAMYYAKAQGKNTIHISDEQSEYFAHKSLALEKEMQQIEQQLNIFLSKDVYTYRHSKRVFKYAVDFGEKLQLTEGEKKLLILGALIHDIGKLEIPRDIINKKGKLDPHEWEMMKKHVTWGKEIISTNKNFEELIPLVELHHERYDGKGYPYGLKGNNIPKLARILCIIDSFDAMTTERPYQKTKTFAEAIQELRECAGKQFDPAFVEPFIEMIEHSHIPRLQMDEAVG